MKKKALATGRSRKRATRAGAGKGRNAMPNREQYRELIALVFPDEKAFDNAIEIAVERDLHAEPIGHFTFVVRKSDAFYFKGLDPQERDILDPARVEPEVLARAHS